MKITYDPEVDVLRIIFSGEPIEESDKEKPGINLDFDKVGNVVAMEIRDASKRVENPEAVEFSIIGQSGGLQLPDGFYDPLQAPTRLIIAKRDEIYDD
jgi:uncharacterized protein YuzE